MNGPKQRIQFPVRQERPFHHGLAVLLGISLLSFLSGCAQFDQLMGKRADAVESTPPAKTATPTPPPSVTETRPAKAAKPSAKQADAIKAEEPRKAPAAPAAGVAKEPEPQMKKADQGKALAETDQPKKEKKSRVASDKKSKKSPKSQDESPAPTEEVSLPPIPLPSKPAAIGGSGG